MRLRLSSAIVSPQVFRIGGTFYNCSREETHTMERRSVLKSHAAAAAVGAVTNLGRGRTVSAESAAGIVGTMGGGGPLGQAKAADRRGMPPLKITDVKIIATA